MQAVLKGLHSIDIADLENFAPHEEDNFGFVLRAMLGPMNREGEESFDITVCTPKWLMEKYGTSKVLLGLHGNFFYVVKVQDEAYWKVLSSTALRIQRIRVLKSVSCFVKWFILIAYLRVLSPACLLCRIPQEPAKTQCLYGYFVFR
jgi:hypothetical protein